MPILRHWKIIIERVCLGWSKMCKEDTNVKKENKFKIKVTKN